MLRPTRSAVSVAALMLLLAAAGCSHRLSRALLPETRPEVTLDLARLDPPGPGTYAWQARWSALASGRKISHYVYAVDPASVDRVDDTWVRTTATQMVLTFPSVDKTTSARASHVFVVRAVDDQGAMSEPKVYAVAEGNIPPSVSITFPVPNPAFVTIVPPTVRFHWQGIDPDGQNPNQLARYVFRLFTEHNPDFPEIPDFIAFALLYPDSLRALYAPKFPGWTSVSGETTSFEYQNLNIGSSYLFVVTGFDEAGDYDPFFLNGKNMMRVAVVETASFGPVLTMFNQYFNYTYPTGGYSTHTSRVVSVGVPADQPVTVNWFAEPAAGAAVRWYRWALDSQDLSDETPRTDENTDLHRWSMRSLTTTSATFGPFSPVAPRVENHMLYIEAEDNMGFRSLGIVSLFIQRPGFARDLLIVDDTRLRPDLMSGPGPDLDPPAGPWPTAAELDTFLYARGGFPWRSYPPGTISPPGIFNGYAFDTVGTRGLGGVTLPMLANYRHVLWYTDETGATFTSPPGDPSTPITELRRMNAPGQANALAAYVQQGGKLWLCGGGAAFAAMITWNRPGTSPSEYTASNFELVPGRFMYDFAHWREGIQMISAVVARKFGTTSFGVGTNRPGRHWPPTPPLPTPPAPPDYTLLPANLDPKNPTTDPVPPLRFNDSFFYRGSYVAEYIHRPTFIREDYNDDPDLVNEYSTMDTLYITAGGTALPNSTVMTYYHGRDNQPLVFSGFNTWYWRRPQCIALVDWVLQSVWGLQRDTGAPREPMARPMAAAHR